jgi:hypothetical protein
MGYLIRSVKSAKKWKAIYELQQREAAESIRMSADLVKEMQHDIWMMKFFCGVQIFGWIGLLVSQIYFRMRSNRRAGPRQT